MRYIYQYTLKLLRPLNLISAFFGELVADRQIEPLSILRISIGTVYLVFGILKFFPEYSPAEDLAEKTIALLTFGLISGSTSLYLLAVLETTIGVTLLFDVALKPGIKLAFFHMLCTFLPLIVLPQLVFTQEPYSLSLAGQYILKNIVIVSALYVIYLKNTEN